MNPTLVTVNTHPNKGRSRPVSVPVAIPDLADVRKLAATLHAQGSSYHGRAWGWEVTYEPEIREAAAQVDVPNDQGGFTLQTMPLWMPASFTIGASGIWFFSLAWEDGVDQSPTAFLDDRNVAVEGDCDDSSPNLGEVGRG